MTKLLKHALAKVLELPEEAQDRAAQNLLMYAEWEKEGVYVLSDEERAAIAESKAQAERGEFATDEEVEAAFARFRE